MNPELEQAYANIRDSLPRLWWNLYQGCLKEGFDESVSLSLVQTFILSQNHKGIRPNDPLGPKDDSE